MSCQTVRALFLKVGEGRFSIIWTLFVKLGINLPAKIFAMVTRRKSLQLLASGLGSSLGGSLCPSLSHGRDMGLGRYSGGPRRVIFFMQNQGFDPATCIPRSMNHSGSLAKVKLPEPIAPLEPFKEKLHIINGLHGLHTSPAHSAFLGLWVDIVVATGFHQVAPPLIIS